MLFRSTIGESLNLQGIHLSESVSGTPESDPSSWVFSGEFRVGDLGGGVINTGDSSPSPATIDVATDTSKATPETSVFINLPMKGTIRVEKASLGGSNFGPIAIDNITVHHLGLRIGTGS